jgi:hypothetical protein
MKKFILVCMIIGMLGSCSSDHHSDKKQQKTVSKSWIGKWERRIRTYDGTLEIKGIKDHSLEFHLFALNGAHTGEIEGVAEVTGDLAIFKDVVNEDTCVVTFTLIGDTIVVIDQKQGDCFAGLNVNYSGNYKNEKLLPKDEKAETLLTLDILKTKEQDSIFRTLVGKHYELFVNCTHMTTEKEDLDSLNATVVSSGVGGLFTFMEHIIMIDKSNNIWAAVIDDNKVYYYTNREDYKNTLPKTIDQWRENFKEYEIIFP